MEDSARALEILESPERNYEDLEWLSMHLMCLEDYRGYARNMSQSLCIQLVRLLSIAYFTRKQMVFHKGQHPEHWFIVYDGLLVLYNTVGGENKLIRRIDKGKQCGEREILRNKIYSYNCMPGKNTVLISMPKELFANLLGDQLNSRLVLARNFVHDYFPHFSGYSWNFKEKIGYNLVLKEYKRGEIVVEKDARDNNLYFVFEGEAAVSVEEENRSKNIVKLGKGMCFAEECTLLGSTSYFTIKISSERAVIASIPREVVQGLPEETIQALKINLQYKVNSRINLVRNRKLQGGNYTTNNSPMFKSANRRAREQLMRYISRNKPSMPKRLLDISRNMEREVKEKLLEFRECSPKKLSIGTGSYSSRPFGGKESRNNSTISYF